MSSFLDYLHEESPVCLSERKYVKPKRNVKLDKYVILSHQASTLEIKYSAKTDKWGWISGRPVPGGYVGVIYDGMYDGFTAYLDAHRAAWTEITKKEYFKIMANPDSLVLT